MSRLRACWATHAPGGVGGHAGDVHLAGGELDEEQYVDPFEDDGVDGEEVASEDAVGLGSEELPPCWSGAAGRGVDAGVVNNVPHGAGGDPVAEADQLAVDASVSPGRVVRSQAQHQLPDLPGDGWPPGLAVRVCPVAGDQLAVPAQQRRRGEEEDRPAGAGE